MFLSSNKNNSMENRHNRHNQKPDLQYCVLCREKQFDKQLDKEDNNGYFKFTKWKTVIKTPDDIMYFGSAEISEPPPFKNNDNNNNNIEN